MPNDQPADLRSYLVESYWPGVTEPGVSMTMRRARQAAEELSGPDSEIRYMTSYLVSKDEVAFCLFDATSVSLVEEACRRAELPFDRIVAIVQIDAGSHV
jgi:Protein of unknown function (DUF4242)